MNTEESVSESERQCSGRTFLCATLSQDKEYHDRNEYNHNVETRNRMHKPKRKNTNRKVET